MRFSIIVPIYNAEKTIERCVKSILSQKKVDLEIILVDDHSTDGSYFICEELKRGCSEIEIYQAEGKGVSAARNTGLKHASGDVIGFCDADDMLESDAFEYLESVFQQNPSVDILVFGYFDSEYGQHLHVIRENAYPSVMYYRAMEMAEKIFTDSRILGSVCNKVYRAKILKEIWFDPDLTHCEDMHYNMQVLSNAKESHCMILNRPLYHYIHNGESATSSVHRLFDKNGCFRFAVAMQAIQDCFQNDRVICDLVIYKRSLIAMDTLRNYCLTTEQCCTLQKELSGGFISMIRTANKRSVVESMKWIMKRLMLIMSE